jgi:hypothetical protein
MHQHALLRKPFPYVVEQRINPYPNGEDADYGTWEKPSMLAPVILSVRPSRCPSFDMPTRRPSMNGSAWPLSGAWRIRRGCLFSHRRKPRLIYHIAKRGEYVEFGLAHHCHGGEKYWVSRDGKTEVLINVD